MRILGLDLGQSKAAWELLDTELPDRALLDTELADTALPGGRQQRRQQRRRRGTVDMMGASLQSLFERLAPDEVVMEAGSPAGWVHDLALASVPPGRASGPLVVVADPTDEAWAWKNVKRKTDADDAAKLVRLHQLGLLNPVHIPPPDVRAKRQLIEYRQALSQDMTRVKNRIRGALLTQGQRLPGGKSGWSEAGRQQAAELAKPLAECELAELWRGLIHNALEELEAIEGQLAEVTAKLNELAAGDSRIARLQSIPGVGPRTAETLVAVLDAPQRFASRRQVSAYAGLVPRRYQSGQMDRDGRITKRGSPLLRHVLNQAAWAAVRCCPEMQAFYLRLCGGQKKRRKRAIVAVMRKLLVLGWALLRDGTTYRPRAAQAAPAVAPRVAQAAAPPRKTALARASAPPRKTASGRRAASRADVASGCAAVQSGAASHARPARA